MSIQQLMLGVGAKKKTYMDDVFSTYVYRGNSTTRSINTGLDMSEGGITWIKSRTHGLTGNIFSSDLVNGSGVYGKLSPSSSAALDSSNSGTATNLSGFTSTGFSLGQDTANGQTNLATYQGSDVDYASWSFRKAPGFFDVVTWTGDNSSSRQISHNLGSVPGMIWMKKTSGGGEWRIWHKYNSTKIFKFTNHEEDFASSYIQSTPTSTQFEIGNNSEVNNNGDDFIAYVFAGGESTAATARSVDFDGDDTLRTSSSNDFILDGDFTIEGWINADSYHSSNENGIFAIGNYQQSGGVAIFAYQNGIAIDWSNQTLLYASTNAGCLPAEGTWAHIAVVRSSNVVTLYVNGTPQGSFNETDDWGNSNEREFGIGARWDQDNPQRRWDGKISNVRVVNGTAVYTSAFKPPTEPLTSITNTKLLCCNNASATGTTTGSISSGGDPTASTDSPFDDPAAFTFGENENQGIIKHGKYIGNGSSTGPEINLGWEPQWVMIKRAAGGTGDWLIWDTIRGIVTGGTESDPMIYINEDVAESTSIYRMDLTSTGFKLTSSNTAVNKDGDSYIFTAIRRPDGYVGKPVKTATNVFAMDTGGSSSTIPNFDSGFIVDMAITTSPGVVSSNWAAIRLMQGYENRINGQDAKSAWDKVVFDSNVGFQNYGSHDSGVQSWMWKRHAGFDVVTTKGGQGKLVPHNLNAVPEMIWLKAVSESQDWRVYHKGANGGTNPEQYGFTLNGTGAENQHQGYWNNVAPTATHFSTGTWTSGGGSSSTDYMMFLFASVSGISKVGYFTNSGGTTTVSCGFQPRFVIVKCSGSSGNWYVYDTLRGINTGGDPSLNLNSDAASGIHTADDIDINSDGFTIPTSSSNIGFSDTHIFYAHA